MKYDQEIAWNFVIGSITQDFAYCGNEEFINGKLVNIVLSLLNISHREIVQISGKGPGDEI